MGKTGEERALDSELRVLGSLPSCGLKFLCLQTLPQARPLSLYISMVEMTSHDGLGGMLELEDTLEMTQVFVGSQGWRSGKACPQSPGRLVTEAGLEPTVILGPAPLLISDRHRGLGNLLRSKRLHVAARIGAGVTPL